MRALGRAPMALGLALFIIGLSSVSGGVEAQTQRSRSAPGAQIPPDARFVASSRGTVYYWRSCSAWRSLARSNLIFFESRAGAEAAGYRASRQSGCAGPADAGSAVVPRARGPAPLRPGSSVSCVVSRVVDGDTLQCAGGRDVRLLLIDAPEAGQGPFGDVATRALQDLVPADTRVTLEIDVDPEDRYGRTLAYVRLADGRIANEELLRAGVAVVSVYQPNVRYVDRFRTVAEEAQLAGRGLWSVNGFECLPSEYRGGRCAN